MNIWELCEGEKYIRKVCAQPWRVVEAQHILSARDLVDNTEEHDILEALLEDSKPRVEKEKNYLIFTPFRYPPLKYGSRFGAIFEPSLWYGSFELATAFREVAHYRWQFLQDTSADLGYLEIFMTAFTVSVVTLKGIDLADYPFSQYKEQISSKNSYECTQLLGAQMRKSNIEAFTYYSARSEVLVKNLAVFTPSVFQMKKSQYITNQQTWICVANKQLIEFTRMGISGKERFSFLANEKSKTAPGALCPLR